MEGGYDNRRFFKLLEFDNNMTYPLILAKIPVKNLGRFCLSALWWLE